MMFSFMSLLLTRSFLIKTSLHSSALINTYHYNIYQSYLYFKFDNFIIIPEYPLIQNVYTSKSIIKLLPIKISTVPI